MALTFTPTVPLAGQRALRSWKLPGGLRVAIIRMATSTGGLSGGGNDNLSGFLIGGANATKMGFRTIFTAVALSAVAGDGTTTLSNLIYFQYNNLTQRMRAFTIATATELSTATVMTNNSTVELLVLGV